jgi:hypothetical protein
MVRKCPSRDSAQGPEEGGVKLYSSDDDLNQKYRELCLAVGHLFIIFGRFEGTLAAILRLHLANNLARHDPHASVVLSSAIYGSMRFKAARDTLRRLAKAEGVGTEIDAFLDGIFAQVGHIENLRDKLAHQTIVAVHPDQLTPDGDWQVSDQTVTRDLKNLKIHVFHRETVELAAHDLTAITARMGNHIVNDQLFDGLKTEPIAWQYKPEMLKHVRLGTARVQPAP